MKCRLCGQPSVGPDKLCGDCARALRRAREGSAALRKLPASPAGQAEATATPFSRAPITLTSVPPPGWRRRVAWGAIGLIAIGVVYLGQREPDRRRAPEAVVVDDGSPMPSATRPDVDSLPGSTPLELLPTTAPPRAPQATVAREAAQAPASPATTQTSAPAKTGARGAKASTSLEPGSGSSSSLYALANGVAIGNSNAGTPSDAEATQRLARASVPQSAATADGAQVLSIALEKCGQEKFLANVICEQKARLQFCDGKWGQIPQCTSRPKVD